MKFSDLPRGAYFAHEGLTYVKLGPNLARNERRERTFFSSDHVVKPCQDAGLKGRFAKSHRKMMEAALARGDSALNRSGAALDGQKP